MKNPSSSTSPSKWVWVAAPVLAALLGLLLGALYTRYLNPANHDRLRNLRIKTTALQRTAGQRRLIVCGDSSVEFGMDPEVLSEGVGLPAINLGFTAGCGALALLGAAEDAAQRDDIVVLSFVPGLVTQPELKPETEGRVLAVSYGKPEISVGGSAPLIPFTLTEHLRVYRAYSCPGLHLILNDIGRPLVGMRGFRYQDCEVTPWGYSIGKVVLPHEACGNLEPLSDKWRDALVRYRDHLEKRGAHLYYTLPWFECAPARVELVTQQAATFLSAMNSVIPVLQARDLGIKADPTLFTDSDVHLSVDGARDRSRELAALLRGAEFRRASQKVRDLSDEIDRERAAINHATENRAN